MEGYCGEKHTLGVVTFSEIVLLKVANSEDVIANGVNHKHANHTNGSEMVGVRGEVASLERVGPGHPDEIAYAEHEPKAICGDVHGCQQSALSKMIISLQVSRAVTRNTPR